MRGAGTRLGPRPRWDDAGADDGCLVPKLYGTAPAPRALRRAPPLRYYGSPPYPSRTRDGSASPVLRDAPYLSRMPQRGDAVREAPDLSPAHPLLYSAISPCRARSM